MAGRRRGDRRRGRKARQSERRPKAEHSEGRAASEGRRPSDARGSGGLAPRLGCGGSAPAEVDEPATGEPPGEHVESAGRAPGRRGGRLRPGALDPAGGWGDQPGARNAPYARVLGAGRGRTRIVTTSRPSATPGGRSPALAGDHGGRPHGAACCGNARNGRIGHGAGRGFGAGWRGGGIHFLGLMGTCPKPRWVDGACGGVKNALDRAGVSGNVGASPVGWPEPWQGTGFGRCRPPSGPVRRYFGSLRDSSAEMWGRVVGRVRKARLPRY